MLEKLDKIKLTKGRTRKVNGLPFVLPKTITVLGRRENEPLIYRSFGVPSTLYDDQSETSETISPSSLSTNN